MQEEQLHPNLQPYARLLIPRSILACWVYVTIYTLAIIVFTYLVGNGLVISGEAHGSPFLAVVHKVTSDFVLIIFFTFFTLSFASTSVYVSTRAYHEQRLLLCLAGRALRKGHGQPRWVHISREFLRLYADLILLPRNTREKKHLRTISLVTPPTRMRKLPLDAECSVYRGEHGVFVITIDEYVFISDPGRRHLIDRNKSWSEFQPDDILLPGSAPAMQAAYQTKKAMKAGISPALQAYLPTPLRGMQGNWLLIGSALVLAAVAVNVSIRDVSPLASPWVFLYSAVVIFLFTLQPVWRDACTIPRQLKHASRRLRKNVPITMDAAFTKEYLTDETPFWRVELRAVDASDDSPAEVVYLVPPALPYKDLPPQETVQVLRGTTPSDPLIITTARQTFLATVKDNPITMEQLLRLPPPPRKEPEGGTWEQMLIGAPETMSFWGVWCADALLKFDYLARQIPAGEKPNPYCFFGVFLWVGGYFFYTAWKKYVYVRQMFGQYIPARTTLCSMSRKNDYGDHPRTTYILGYEYQTNEAGLSVPQSGYIATEDADSIVSKGISFYSPEKPGDGAIIDKSFSRTSDLTIDGEGNLRWVKNRWEKLYTVVAVCAIMLQAIALLLFFIK